MSRTDAGLEFRARHDEIRQGIGRTVAIMIYGLTRHHQVMDADRLVVVGEDRNVSSTISQRRDSDREGSEMIEQVSPKRALLDISPGFRISGRHDPDMTANCFCASHSLEPSEACAVRAGKRALFDVEQFRFDQRFDFSNSTRY